MLHKRMPHSDLRFQVAQGVERRSILGELIFRAWGWLNGRLSAKNSGRRLQVTATVPLGEKRFIAVVNVDGHEYLVGGGAANVALLARMDEGSEKFAQALKRATHRSDQKSNTKQRRISAGTANKPALVDAVKTVSVLALSPAKSKAVRSTAANRWTAQLNVAPAVGHFRNTSKLAVAPTSKVKNTGNIKKQKARARKLA